MVHRLPDYVLTQPTTTANITQATLTVTGITASNKVYDRTTKATLNLAGAELVGVLSGDTVSLNTNVAVGQFASATILGGAETGYAQSVNVTGLTISGARATDYTLKQPTTTASVTPAPLTVSGITASDKVYDGTTTATLNLAAAAIVGLVPGDQLSLFTGRATGSFANKSVGKSLTVSVAGLFFQGGFVASSYTLTQPTATATITPAPLTLTAQTDTKSFDGTATAAAVPTITGLQPGDTVTGLTETFSDANVGTGKALNVAGYTINDGNNGNNYTVTTVADSTGAITPAPANLVITNLSATNITAGGNVSFTVTAVDSSGQAVPGYTGTVQLSSSAGGVGLPVGYTFLPGDKGLHNFTVPLTAAGSQTITVADQTNKSLSAATAPITVNTGTLNKFVVSSLGSNALTAGTAFIVTVQATDAFGNPITNFSGLTKIPITLTPVDPLAVMPSELQTSEWLRRVPGQSWNQRHLHHQRDRRGRGDFGQHSQHHRGRRQRGLFFRGRPKNRRHQHHLPGHRHRPRCLRQRGHQLHRHRESHQHR